ncbi:hypothetical protein FRC07_002284, partial [Ceratobasidium sp. 392]
LPKETSKEQAVSKSLSEEPEKRYEPKEPSSEDKDGEAEEPKPPEDEGSAVGDKS